MKWEEDEESFIVGNMVRVFRPINNHNGIIDLLEMLYTDGLHQTYKVVVYDRDYKSTLEYLNKSNIFANTANKAIFKGPNAIDIILYKMT